MKSRGAPAIVGGFVIGGMVLFLAGMIVFGGGRLLRKTYDFVIFIPGSVSGLNSGAVVKFKGVEIGWVRSVHVDLWGATSRPDDIRVPVVISIDAAKLRSHGEEVNLGNAKVFGSFIQKGLRAQLGTSSFVTGLRYISLDFYPDTPIDIVDDSPEPYQQIPYHAGQLDDVQKKIVDLLDRLSRLDYESLLASAQRTAAGIERTIAMVEHTVAGIDKLANAPELMEGIRALKDAAINLDAAVIDLRKIESQVGAQGIVVGKNLAAASESAVVAAQRAATFAQTLAGMIHPLSPFLVQLGDTLNEVGGAARSFRHVMDEIARDPASILRGRSP